MRPNSCGASSCSISSSSWASALSRRASGSVISSFGSVTAATTFLRAKTRRVPVWRSICIRTLSAAPMVFLDADSRADSSASKRTSFPIPFSRPICSIT